MAERETQKIQNMTQATLHSLRLKNTNIKRVREELEIYKDVGEYGFTKAEWTNVCAAVLEAAEAYAAEQPAPVKIVAQAIEPLPLATMVARASAKLKGKTLVRKIGDYDHKGSTGIYVQVVGTERYAALDWACLPDEQFPAIRRGEAFEAPMVETYYRIDQCLD